MMSRRWAWAPAAALAAFGAEFVLQDKLERPEPFAESRLGLNPPTFRWPAAAGARAYRIELARDGGFSKAQGEVVAAAFHRPLQPLAAGEWRWRYRVEQPAPGEWSKPETFAIPSGLARWAVPEWPRLMSRIPAAHPRLYLRPGEQKRIQENARSLGAGFERWKRRTKRIAREPYSLDTYQKRVPATGDARAKKELIWAAKAAGVDMARPIADLAWAWVATGDRWFLDAAKRRALEAARLDPEGFVSERNSDFGNAAIVNGLAQAYDLLFHEFSRGEREEIRTTIATRCEPIFAQVGKASQQLMRAHNWQHVFLDGMMGAAAIHGEEPRAAGWVELGLKSFVAMYPWFGGKDGGSHEGARYYHATELIPSLNTRDLFENVFGLRLEDGNPWFRANPYYLMYAFPPGSVKARLGDSSIGAPAEDDEDDAQFPAGRARLAALRMAALYGNGHAAAYAAAIAPGDGGYPMVEALRWGTRAEKAEPLDTLPAARAFEDIGAVFTHSHYQHPERNVRLVFHASPYGGFGHGHADQNSFHIIAANEDLLIDSGYYTPAGDPHRERWSLQSKAHNTILVDGGGQKYGDTRGHGRIRHFEQNNDWVYMMGSAESAYPATKLRRFDRHIVWLKGKAVQMFVVVDDIQAEAGKHRFDWLLHAVRRMEVDEAARRVVVRGAKSEAIVTFLEPGALRLAQDDKFDVPAVFWRKGQNFPLPNQWHLKAAPAEDSTGGVFLTVIQVSPSGAEKQRIEKLPGGVATAGFRVAYGADGGLLKIARKEQE